jgi:hypothetical protein
MIFLSLETIETWIVTVCRSEGEWTRQKDWSAFERGTVVGARHTGLCQELQRCWVSRVYEEWSTTQRTSSQLDKTVGSIGVNMGQHPCGTPSTPCRGHELRLFWGQKGGATQYQEGVLNVFYTQCMSQWSNNTFKSNCIARQDARQDFWVVWGKECLKPQR